jgi:hypothetical protein
MTAPFPTGQAIRWSVKDISALNRSGIIFQCVTFQKNATEVKPKIRFNPYQRTLHYGQRSHPVDR